jgi:osmotically-inducible protein OsmY
MQRTIGRIVLGAAIVLALAAPAMAASAPDAWITTKVKIGLLTSEGLGTARGIDVDTVDGRVTLHGAVASAQAKDEAARVARNVGGVRDVRNLLSVEPARASERADVPDTALRERVQAALAADAALKDSRIEVRSVDDGVVVLAGEARSLSDARRAIEDAAGVDGVRRVANEIQSPDQLSDLETWREGAYDKAAYAGSTARDAWITSATKMRLLANSETPAFDINVDTRDQVVTLFGTVDSEQAKRQAEAEARKVDGVREVENALQVVEPAEASSVKRTDEQLDAAIEERFDASQRLADADIGVEVENGVARLTGAVPTRSDEMAALTLARSTQGVRRVIDDLEVAPAVGAR